MGGGTGIIRGMHVNLYIFSARSYVMHEPITHVGVFSPSSCILSLGFMFFVFIIQFHQGNICLGLHLRNTGPFNKYEARAQASQSSAHAAPLLSAALVTGINRKQGKCHAHS